MQKPKACNAIHSSLSSISLNSYFIVLDNSELLKNYICEVIISYHTSSGKALLALKLTRSTAKSTLNTTDLPTFMKYMPMKPSK